jgi:hypothetical protein
MSNYETMDELLQKISLVVGGGGEEGSNDPSSIMPVYLTTK